VTNPKPNPARLDPTPQTLPTSPPVPELPRPVPIDWLGPNPYQPRLRSLAEDPGIDVLAEDMRQYGYRGSLMARHDPRNPQGKLQLVFGHRRLEAARRAGLATISVQLVAYSDDEMRLGTIRENLLREDLRTRQRITSGGTGLAKGSSGALGRGRRV
jgi:ParB/RepB/Spo0J family partition protein